MANNEYRIYVDTRIVGNASDVSTSEQTPETASKNVVEKSNGNSVGAVVAVQMGKKALQWGISNYGDLTGDHIGQAQIKTAIDFATAGAMIAASPVIGTAAVVGGLAVKAVETGISIAKSNRTAERLRLRTQTATTNGGR